MTEYLVLGMSVVVYFVSPLLIKVIDRKYLPAHVEVEEESEDEDEEEDEDMKKIPEKFHLDEDDIKEAIKEWLYNNHDVDTDDITVTLSVEHKQEQPDTPYRGGMSDWVDKAIFSAVAEKDA